MLIDILIAKGNKSKDKANIPQQRGLHNKHRTTLTHLHLVQGKGCKGAHTWKQQATSTLLSFSLNIY